MLPDRMFRGQESPNGELQAPQEFRVRDPAQKRRQSLKSSIPAPLQLFQNFFIVRITICYVFTSHSKASSLVLKAFIGKEENELIAFNNTF